MDDIILTSLLLSIASMLSNIILHYKLKHCHSLCCSSDCVNNEPKTPTTKQSLLNKV